MIDLHLHSTFSDGQHTPEELVRDAVTAGLTAIALTDHDTIAGWARLESSALAAGIRPVRGVEVSAAHADGPLHILGYGFAGELGELCRMLEQLQRGREERNRQIAERLDRLGAGVRMEEVRALGGEGGQIGRVHFARALVAAGHAATTQEAFDRWLGRGRPAYVERFRFPVAQVIRVFHRAGGLAVLAHPGLIPAGEARLEQIVRELAAEGLDGLEAIHSRHGSEQVARFHALAKRYGLVATGGSDFHGPDARNASDAGTVGGVPVPDEVLAEMDARRARLSGRSPLRWA
ncbi:MAG: PHP domain-containing protein [Kiritimatiellae bacterium]|nr:PHP domain-containing protein [Kiritimatiellia bacterium]